MPGTVTTAVTREAGRDRIAAAVRISASHFETGTVEAAVLVNGYSFADSLAAPALAGAVDGPVLLSGADRVSDALLDELDRLGVETVYLVGGPRSLSAGVRDGLLDAGFRVSRISGANRFATAAAVAVKVSKIRGGVDRAFVVNVDGPYDAITAASYSYSQGFPVLFTTATSLPAETVRAIRTAGIDNVTVIGGTSAVSKMAYTALTRTTTGKTDNRIAGSSRFDNARLLAQYAIDRGWADANHVGLVNGAKGFSEALVGAAVTGARNGVVLLVTTTDIPRPTELFLTQFGDAGDIDGIHLYGGLGMISDSVMAQVQGLGINHDGGTTPTDPPHAH